MSGISLQVAAPASTDMIDVLITVIILLFILSTITEKLTELVRMYPGQFRIIGYLFCAFFYFQIIAGSFNEPLLGIITASILFLFNTFLLFVIIANTINPKEAKNRFTKLITQNLLVLQNVSKNAATSKEVKEREVTALSFLLGLIVAFLFNADLFKLLDFKASPVLRPSSPFANSPMYQLDPDFFNLSFISTIGFILSAFFLAFGSKFFHDLLDTMLQVKDLKRKANQSADQDFGNIKEFDTWFATQEKDNFQAFLNQNLTKPGIYYESDFDNNSVTVFISDPSVAVPDVLFYKNAIGKIVPITVV